MEIPVHKKQTAEFSDVDINRARDRLRSGRALLFIGAGFSLETKNVDGKSPPDAKHLAHEIARLSGMPDDDDLKYVSDRFLQYGDPQDLIRLLTRLYTVKDVTPAHSIITGASWRRIYTTNYDNSVELSARLAGSPYHGITIADAPSEYASRENICIHINGSIDRLTAETINAEFKLSRSSYVSSDSFLESSWHYIFKKDLEWCSGIFFVGYSLYDMEVEKLLYESPEFKEKTFFVLGESPTEKEIFTLSKYGCVLPIGVKGLARLIKEIEYSGESDEFWLDAFVEKKITESEEEITDSEIWDFLLHGRINKSHIDLAITGIQEKKYLVVRHDVAAVAQHLMDGQSVVVHSEFGNGKSVFLDEVASYLTIHGIQVFIFTDEDGDYIADIDKIIKANVSAVLVVDGYTKQADLIKYYSENPSPRICLLLSDRTYAYEHSSGWLATNLPTCVEYNIDLLTDDECKEVAAIVENLGKWDFAAGLSKDRKASIICKENNRQISHVLLVLFDAPQIRDRISHLLSPLFVNEKEKNTVFAICLLEVMDFPRTKSLISEVAGNNEIYSVRLWKNAEFRQLFTPRGEKIETKSSVFSLHLLRKHLSSSYITDRLLMSITHFNNVQDGGFVQKEIFKSLMRFSFIERLLPEENKRNSLVKFYEELKVRIPWLTKSPHYWLQYAMARMTFHELDKAEAYLKQAYAIAANKEGYDTSYLDAQQGRLYLLRSLENRDPASSYEQFANAHRILSPLDNNVYKFRQVLAYEKIYLTKYPAFSKRNKVNFEHACKKMLDDTYIPVNNFQNIKGESVTSDCKNTLEKILDEIKQARRNITNKDRS